MLWRMAAVVGKGGREKGLNRAWERGMFSVPEEGMRSRAGEKEGCSGCRERQCPGCSNLGFSRTARLGTLTSCHLQPHSTHDPNKIS